ncbi:MAG: hypothetical protein ACLVL7_02925 [Anaerotruncus massiliensis (ex Togo et al. 2019)]
MLFVIATAAVIVATLLLIPIVKVGSTSGARRRVLANAGVFLIATLLMIMMAVGVSAETPDPDTARTLPPSRPSPPRTTKAWAISPPRLPRTQLPGRGHRDRVHRPAAIGAFSEDPKAFGRR